MTRTFLIVLLLLLTTACSQQQPSVSPDAQIKPTRTEAGASDLFEFHSDPWINLHHFLYQWSRADEGLGSGRQTVAVPERGSLSSLSPEQRDTWLQAVSFYRQSVAPLDHFDDAMLEQKKRLLNLTGDPQATPPDQIPGIAEALATAMPVYLQHWWPAHDTANRQWTAGVTPVLSRHEHRYAELTARIYHSQWPPEPKRVDVSAYANPAAGYTADGHTVIFSTDSGNQGLYAVETILHEVLHNRDIGSPGRIALNQAMQATGDKTPRNLWHAMIFATAGEFTQAIAEREGLPEHIPYWTREGFQNFQGWREPAAWVNQHWLPVVRSQISVTNGLDNLTEAVSSYRETLQIIARARKSMAAANAISQTTVIETLADVQGPDSEFQTRVVSAMDGRMRFEQIADDGTFNAGIGAEGAWQINPDSGETEPASAVTKTFLRGHELHALVLAPETRLRSPQALPKRQFSGQEVRTIRFVDALDGALDIYYAISSGLPIGMQMINHTGRGNRKIQVHLSDWQNHDGVLLFSQAIFTQGNEVYVYRYTKINLKADSARL